jgi:hypothetical protein
MGRKVELLDAFGWTKGDIGEMAYTVRVGRHTLLYGETLFYGGNGIANAQGPSDVVKLLNVPSSQFKEILRPVGQVSGTLQVNSDLSLSGYYQFQWEESRIPPAGSYLSSADFVGDGSDRLIVGGPIIPGGGAAAFWRGGDIEASDQGQGGFALRYSPPNSNYNFGLYAAVYHEKGPALYLVPNPAPTLADLTAGNIGQLRLVFPENIKTFGFSVTSSIGQLNWAAEMSWRIDAPLNSDPQLDVTGTADNDDNPLYAIGDTMHANLNGIYVMPPTRFWEGGSILGEVAWNYVMDCTENCDPALANGFSETGALDPNTTDHGVIFRLIVTPSYFQVIPGLDVDVPINLGYNLYGRSGAVGIGPFTQEHAGDIGIGLDTKYRQVWQIGLNYTHYFGAGDTLAVPNSRFLPGPAEFLSFGQTLKDRDFISFNIRRTF